jgi:hypothetical protein
MAFPILFDTPQIQSDPTLRFSYAFDTITAIKEANSVTYGKLPVATSPELPAYLFTLTGPSANPNMSITTNGNTTTFGLRNIYITKCIPNVDTKVDDSDSYSFVIEGYSTKDVDSVKILVFIPLTKDNTGNTMNAFSNFDNYVTTGNSQPLSANLNLGTFIPGSPYYHYLYKDSNSINYHVVFFPFNNLLTYDEASPIMGRIVNDPNIRDFNGNGYSDPAYTANQSIGSPNNMDSISDLFDESIFIDCQPVEVLNEESGLFIKMNGTKMSDYMDMSLTYIFIILVIGGIIWIIFKLKTWIRSPDNAATKDLENALNTVVSRLEKK